MTKETTEHPRMIFTVLLYPISGVPRVVEIAEGIAGPYTKQFTNLHSAEAALEEWLTRNPEYRRWRDGRIQPAEGEQQKGSA